MATKRERAPVMSLYEWNLTLWYMSEARNRLDGTGRGIYRELLDWCYGQGTIPDDHAAMARQCAVTGEQFEAVWPTIKTHFFRSRRKENSLENKVANVQRRQYFDFISQQRVNGARGGKKRVKSTPIDSVESIGLGNPVLEKNVSQEETRREEKTREDKRRDEARRENENTASHDSDLLGPLKRAVERFVHSDPKILSRIMLECRKCGVDDPGRAAWAAMWSISEGIPVRSPGLFLMTVPEFLNSQHWVFLRDFLDDNSPLSARKHEAEMVLSARKAPEKILSALRLWLGEQS